jgi:hypothetical protein
MVRENSGTLTVMSTKATGKMTKLTASVSIFMSMARDTRVSGKTIYKTAGVLKAGPMDLSMRVDTRRA